ncbi:MAG: formate hydrogenlyase [Gammaproteobacteria bacterium]
MHPPLIEQAVFALAALVLFVSFALLALVRTVSAIHAFAWQGAFVAAVAALAAHLSGDSHLYISAVIIFVLKVVAIPWMLHRLARSLGVSRQADVLPRPILTLLTAAALVIFSYWIALPLIRLDTSTTRNVIPVSLAVVLLGLLMMAARRQAIAQVLGFMSLENGLFLAAVAATRGMPLVVELGIAFDLLVAMVLFGIFFLHIRGSIDSLDVDRLVRLSEGSEEYPQMSEDIT